jgi:hypothetical protein
LDEILCGPIAGLSAKSYHFFRSSVVMRYTSNMFAL